MASTAVNLPKELTLELRRLARAAGVSESDVICEILRRAFAESQASLPEPTSFQLSEQVKTAIHARVRKTDAQELDRVRRSLVRTAASVAGNRPRIPLFHSNDPTLAERVDEYLQGFGER